MKDFAKIFNDEKYGQILVTNDHRESGTGEELPSINFSFTLTLTLDCVS